MKKKYLMNGLAVMAVGLFAASCSKDVELSKTDIVSNAEYALGVKIAANQDWNMINNVTARVTVNLGTGEDYTLYVYDKSPFDNNDAVYFTKQTVKDASITEVSLSLPSYLKEVYVSVFDSKNHSYSRSIAVSGNYIFPVFGTAMESSFTRSQTDPEVLTMSAPYDEAWVAEYLKTAKEPNSTNVNHNNNNSVYHEAVESEWIKTKDAVPGTPGYYPKGWWVWNEINKYRYTPGSDEYTWIQTYLEYWLSHDWELTDEKWAEIVAQAEADGYTKFLTYNEGTEGTPEEGYWTEAKEAYWEYDENWVTNFKITGTWDGNITVAASEGSSSPGSERTIVVTGTWNITVDQTVGSLGKIIIANGGTVNVADGKKLNMVNQAQLVVLSGGKLTGDGSVEVNNGTAEGMENYNGGTIDVAKFNNNFGKFFNYGKFLVNEYDAGATESNFYNHSLVAIDHTGNTPNARIFNACQFYVANDARLRNYEGVASSALIVGGQLMPFGSADGTSVPSFVSLAAGALVQAGSLYNGSSWIGPTDGGYAVLKIGQFDYMNWVQDHPEQGGYFINNIYLVADELTNVPGGQGMQQKTDDGTEYYTMSKADWKFKNVVANAGGNGNTKIATTGDYEVIPADADFVLGEKGCTPGFKIKEIDDPDPDLVERNDPPYESSPQIYTYAFEDTYMGDYDLNDVVLKVWEENSKLKIQLCASGASKSLYVYYNDSPLFQGAEVHSLLGAPAGKFVNTGVTDGEKFYSGTPAPTEIAIPEGFDYATAGFNIRWGNKTQAESIWLTTRSDSPIGVAPYAVCIPADWAWPLEWVKVSDAYTEFSSYAADPSSNEEWYKSPTEGKTY